MKNWTFPLLINLLVKSLQIFVLDRPILDFGLDSRFCDGYTVLLDVGSSAVSIRWS